MEKKTQKIYFENMKHLVSFMTISNTEIMRDEEVIFDSLIACIVTAVELEGKGTSSIYTQFLIWLGFIFFFSPPAFLLAQCALQIGGDKSPLPLVNSTELWAHLPRSGRIDQVLYIT